LNDADLKALGRTHTGAEARTAFDIARSTFDRVSFDMIYARMGQTVAAWEVELAGALDMAIDHLSLYQLTIEEGTRFAELHAAGKLQVPADDRAAEMYAVSQDMTEAAGMPAYEISNHARPGSESRHNLIYWRYGDYCGIGPGAHARLTLQDGRRYAQENVRLPERWRTEVMSSGHPVVRQDVISSVDQAAEYLMMSMRLVEGTSLSRFEGLSGVPLNERAIATLCDSGHLILEGDRVMATPLGRMVLNTVIAELLR
jgi:oxygen-independent coproporphyrinogen-3 oxidase